MNQRDLTWDAVRYVVLMCLILGLIGTGLVACKPARILNPFDAGPVAASPAAPSPGDPDARRGVGTVMRWVKSAAGAIPAAPAAEAPAAPAAKLGREEARQALAQTATWIGRIGYLAGFASIVLLVAGSLFGVGRGWALTGLAVSAGCVVARYFVLVYGVLVSEVICWAILLALMAALAAVATVGVGYIRSTLRARTIAAKRAEAGAPAADAIQALPVARTVKSALDDAWEYLRDPAPGEPLLEAQAKRLLQKFRLPIPATSSGEGRHG